VEVVVEAEGAPVADASVCLRSRGDFYATARTNASGVASLPVRAERTGTAELTVWGAGLIPHQSSVHVRGTVGPLLRTTDVPRIDDSAPAGNGNGLLEAGERAWLQVEVKNDGGSVANAATLRLQSANAALVIDETPVALGSLEPGMVVLSERRRIEVALDVSDQRHITLPITLTSTNAGPWVDAADFVLSQADPRLFRITPQTDGSNPAPDEIYDLQIEIKNYGSAPLEAATARLRSTDPEVQILQQDATLGHVDPLESATARFSVRETQVDSPNLMIVDVSDAHQRTWSFEIETRRPEPPTGLFAHSRSGPGAVQLLWSPSPSTDVLGYRVYRIDEVDHWSLASADVVRSATLFRDDGLMAFTDYAYVVVAVDSSGNESAPTSRVDVRTDPQANDGWPQSLNQWSGSAPIVADLDGDMRNEIVVGADRVYAWEDDGREICDGDNDSTTHGIWNPSGDGFDAGLAAGDLDRDGRVEVVACSWGTREVYVFDSSGKVAPGWPRVIDPSSPGIWATPAVADLDLDGSLEVVVLGLDGRVYAWHADGGEVRDGDTDPATQGVFFDTPGNPTWSRGAPVVAQVLADDATPEIIFGTSDHNIYMLRADGSVAPGWPVRVGGEVTCAPSLGNIDADGGLEIAVAVKGGMLHVLHADGSAAAGWPRPFETTWHSLTPSVALHDFDADGRLELVVGGSSNAIQGELWMFDWRGEVVPGWPAEVESASASSPVVGDVDGDGLPEILFGGEAGLLFGFGRDGGAAPGFPIKLPAEIRATPTITDVDRDGDVDVVLPGWDQRVHILDFPGDHRPGSVPWGTFKGNNLRNGLYGFEDPTLPGPAPKRTRLFQNVPNPFNPITTIEFEVAGRQPQSVLLAIYNVRGRLVRTLVNRDLFPGRYAEIWDGRDDGARRTASGVYFYRLVTHDAVLTRKMLLLQ
jgi:hypothetical protein